MTITVPDFGQAQITCGGVKLVFQGPNHPPTCLVKDENNRTSKTTIKINLYYTQSIVKHPKEQATKTNKR